MHHKKLGIVLVFVIGVAAIISGAFFAGFRYGKRFPKNLVVEGAKNIDSNVADFSTFWQAWQVVNDNYLKNKDVAGKDKLYGSIAGLVGSLKDPYSEFFPPEENKKFQEDVRGDFGGIGAELGMDKGQLVVIAPLKDTPAARAGVKAGDRILSINASSTDGILIEQAVNAIRGPKGTAVVLGIIREGWKAPQDFKIMRGTIIVPTIEFEMKDGNIAYVGLRSFNANAEQLFYEAIAKATDKQARGVILDLRDDPGGFLDVAVELAGWFLPRGTLVVSETSRTGTGEQFKAEGNEALIHTPVVVLVNKGSASASEILAGALRDDRNIKLVGEKTFGKGTVQQLFSLHNDSSLKLTIAHWVLPSGHILENGGLKPDIEVKLTDENVKNKKDPQLDKAMEILTKEIATSQ